jgi:hypothetical protein
LLRHLHPSLELLVDIRSPRTTLFLRENFPCLAHKHDNICIREDPVVFSHGLLECLHLQPSPVDEQKSESYVTTTILSVESLRLTLSVSVIVFFVSTIAAGLQEGPIEGDEGIPVELWRSTLSKTDPFSFMILPLPPSPSLQICKLFSSSR